MHHLRKFLIALTLIAVTLHAVTEKPEVNQRTDGLLEQNARIQHPYLFTFQGREFVGLYEFRARANQCL